MGQTTSSQSYHPTAVSPRDFDAAFEAISASPRSPSTPQPPSRNSNSRFISPQDASRHRRQISFGDNTAQGSSGFLKRSTKRLSSVFTGNNAADRRKAELLAFLQPVPASQFQSSPSASSIKDDRQTSVGPMRPRPGAARPKSGAMYGQGELEAPDTFMVLPAPSSSAWNPNRSPVELHDSRFPQEPVVTSQPQQSSPDQAYEQRGSDRRSRIIRRPRIRSQSLPGSAPAPSQELPSVPAQQAAVAADPSQQQQLVSPPTNSSMKRWSVARSSITPIPEGPEDEEMSERRMSGQSAEARASVQTSVPAAMGMVGVAITSPDNSRSFASAAAAFGDITGSVSGASSAGGAGSGSASGSQSAPSSSGGPSALSPSFGRNSRDSGGTAPSAPPSDRGHTPVQLPAPLASVLKQGLGKGWSRAEILAAVAQVEAEQQKALASGLVSDPSSSQQRRSLDSNATPLTLDSDKERLLAYWETLSQQSGSGSGSGRGSGSGSGGRPMSWSGTRPLSVATSSAGSNPRNSGLLDGQERPAASGMVGIASPSEGSLTHDSATVGGRNAPTDSRQKNNRNSVSSFLNMGEESSEQFAMQAAGGSLDPRTAMLSAPGSTTQFEPVSPAAPSSVFEAPGMREDQSPPREEGSNVVVPVSQANAPGPSQATTSAATGQQRAASHSRSGSRHSAAISVMSGTSAGHAEVETLRRGPRATIVDPASVADLFDQAGIAAPKRRALGILGRLKKNKRKGKKSNGIHHSPDQSVDVDADAGMTDAGMTEAGGTEGMTDAGATEVGMSEGTAVAGQHPADTSETSVTPRALRRTSEMSSLERRQLRRRSVRSMNSLKRNSATSLRGKSVAKDSSPTSRSPGEILAATAAPAEEITDAAEPAWEDVEEKLPIEDKTPPSTRWQPSSWQWAKRNDSDSSVSNPATGVKLLRNDSVQSASYSGSSEGFGNITATQDISATLHEVDNAKFEIAGPIMDQQAFSREREKEKETELQRYSRAAAAGSPGQTPLYEVPPPPRARRRQASGASTSESSSSNALTATAPLEGRAPERQVLAPPDFAPSAPRISPSRSNSGTREILASPAPSDEEARRLEIDTLASLPRLPASFPSASAQTAVTSDQLSSMGSDYKHRGDPIRSREASESSTLMMGNQTPAQLELDPVKAASAPHLGHVKKDGSEATVMSAVPPPRPVVQAAEQSVDGEISFESDSLPNLLRQNVDRASNSTFGRQREIPPPFSSPTFGTAPNARDSALMERNYPADPRASWISGGGFVPGDGRYARVPDARKGDELGSSKFTSSRERKTRRRSKSDPTAVQSSDLDTSADTLPEPVPFPETAVQASLAALHALERSDDLGHEWAFERLMGTGGRSAGQQFDAARRRLELLQAAEEQQQMQNSRPRRRADPYRSSRMKRASEESASSSREEGPSRRNSARYNRSTRRHLLDASGMATMSKRSFTGSESEEVVDALRKLSQGRKSRVSEKRPQKEVDTSLRRPRVPSDWRQDIEAGPSTLPKIEEPLTSSQAKVLTAAEWDETVVPALRNKAAKDRQDSQILDKSPKSSRSKKLQPSPRQLANFPLEPVEGQDSAFVQPDRATPSVTRSRKSSSTRKHRPTKQGYQKEDILAWQASLSMAQMPP